MGTSVRTVGAGSDGVPGERMYASGVTPETRIAEPIVSQRSCNENCRSTIREEGMTTAKSETWPLGQVCATA
jgi:hypothetical protein